MTDYNINYTDKNKNPITITEGDEDTTSTDVALFGRIKLEYGQELNEDLLHLLENFAAPEITGSTLMSANPDFANATYNRILSHPTSGQLWYNTSRSKFYFWNGVRWFPITNRGDYAANWGIIADGYQLPKPKSDSTGYLFDYSECIWSVSPANFNGKFDYMVCSADDTANVTMKYRYSGQSSLVGGIANYLIIGIRSNVNLGTNVSPPLPTPTPSPSNGTTPPVTPTVTPTGTSSVGVTPTSTPTITPTPSITTSVTPSVTPSVGASPSVTPTRTPTRTPTPTPTRSVSVTPAPTVTQTPPPTPTPTRSSVPPMTVAFTDGKSGSPTFTQPLNSLSSYCNQALHGSAGDSGYTCSGTPQTCSAGACAPEPGDTGPGPELKIVVTGGTAPYNVMFTNWLGSFSSGSSECIVLRCGASILAVPANSSGTVNSSLTMTKTIAVSGGDMGALASLTSKCKSTEGDGNGTFDVIITDSNGASVTRTLSWALSWYNTNH